MGGSRSHSEFFFGKSSQNSSKPVLIFWSSIPYVFCLYILLKVVSHYDLSVLSMSVIGFPKKVWMEVGGWGELYPSLFLKFYNFAKPLGFCHCLKYVPAYAAYFILSKGLPHDSANGCCLFIQLFLDCRATLYCGSRPTRLSCRHTSSSRFFSRPACPLVS